MVVGRRSGDAVRGDAPEGSVGAVSAYRTEERRAPLQLSFPRIFSGSLAYDEHDQSMAEERPSIPRRVAGHATRRGPPADLLVEHSVDAVLSVSVCLRALQFQRAAGPCGQLAGGIRLQFDDHEVDDSLDESPVRYNVRQCDFESIRFRAQNDESLNVCRSRVR